MATGTERGMMLRAAIRTGGGLLNQRQVAAVIGRNTSTTNMLVDSADFPKPIARVGVKTRLWLHEEVVKWMHKHPKQYGGPAREERHPSYRGV